jgi:hypothetical protein
MVTPRIFVYLVPRLSHLFGWTVDTNSLVDPLLQKKELPNIHKPIGETFRNVQQSLYQPPPYTAPHVPKVSS